MDRSTNFNLLADEIEKWVIDKGFKSERSKLWELFVLAHSEISEAVDAYKKGKDEEVIGEELVDAIIRIIHIMKIFGLDIDYLYNSRMDYNWTRPSRFNTVRTSEKE